MDCTRCSHPLLPRADRCLRCFALNPQNRPSEPVRRVSQPVPPSTPVRKVELDFASEPPAAPAASRAISAPIVSAPAQPAAPLPESGSLRVGRKETSARSAKTPGSLKVQTSAALKAQLRLPISAGLEPPSFEEATLDFDAVTAPAPPFLDLSLSAASERAALGEPLDEAFASEHPVRAKLGAPPAASFSEAASSSAAKPLGASLAEAAPAASPSVAPPVAVSAPADATRYARGRTRLRAFAIDAGILCALFLAQLTLTALVCGRAHEWLDLLFSASLRPLWLVLAACDALAWSWLFGAVGRTPGMAAQRQRLHLASGRKLDPAEALQRALLSLLSAALALSGFFLALFDRRGQTLHDKLCGSVVTLD